MSGRVCAYCQRDATDGRGQVEHFRPKAVYRWLQYEFSNYYLSCSMCNGQRKLSKFPLEEGAPAMTTTNGLTELDERRLLIDPGIDDVERWVRVDWRDPLCSVEAVDGLSSEASQRVETTIRFFHLNTNLETRQDRRDKVNDALALVVEVDDGNDFARHQLLKMANRYRPHGTAIRQLIAETTDLPLPTLEDDLAWYVKRILRAVHEGEDLLAAETDPARRRDLNRTIGEAYWSLAVLLKDPPGHPAVDAAGWIDPPTLTRLQGYVTRL
ncbi:hypothetical protein PDG61_20940 [Mycolicibacterium sp. BiH015]|uniref:hypothetical protein n=1 Tax=Mycolicibacterium sp. BiH015 TaxID=3018808 RepID=UPI0022DFED55|nr:hypothetical protein [Mycolicibacterium sp. BiH015]MDA2893394.1 hypothetical protein [Mycolicibacterium sp. BiH015]